MCTTDSCNSTTSVMYVSTYFYMTKVQKTHTNVAVRTRRRTKGRDTFCNMMLIIVTNVCTCMYTSWQCCCYIGWWCKMKEGELMEEIRAGYYWPKWWNGSQGHIKVC